MKVNLLYDGNEYGNHYQFCTKREEKISKKKKIVFLKNENGKSKIKSTMQSHLIPKSKKRQ